MHEDPHTAYLREIQLPSKGYFYGGQIPQGLIQIEPMGTREEKIFASGSSPNTRQSIIDQVFDTCVKAPIPHKQLAEGDRLYILFRLRAISGGTEGDTYVFSFLCDHCGKTKKAAVKISELPVLEAVSDEEDGPHEQFSCHLPILGIDLILRHLTGVDSDKIRRYAQGIEARSGDKQAEAAEYVYRNALKIVTVNGEEVGIREAMELVEKLRGDDSVAFKDALDANEIGIDLWIEPECSGCGFINPPSPLPVTSEFFRSRRRRSLDIDHIRAAEMADDPGKGSTHRV
jgi:hypothetical protein